MNKRQRSVANKNLCGWLPKLPWNIAAWQSEGVSKLCLKTAKGTQWLKLTKFSAERKINRRVITENPKHIPRLLLFLARSRGRLLPITSEASASWHCWLSTLPWHDRHGSPCGCPLWWYLLSHFPFLLCFALTWYLPLHGELNSHSHILTVLPQSLPWSPQVPAGVHFLPSTSVQLKPEAISTKQPFL